MAVARRIAALALVAPLLTAIPARAEMSAREILVEMEARHRNRSQIYRGELEVRTKAGKVRKKSWRSFRRGYAGDAMLLIRFVHPPEVRGVGFLSLGRPGKHPEQWMYLPSMRRERRVGSRDCGASFVGTDFNYEDMDDYDHARYEVELAGEDVVDGHPVYLMEAEPKERSVYERQVLAVRKDILFTVRVVSYKAGRKQPWKRLELRDVDEVDGHWVARTMVMRDLEKERETTVRLEELAFDVEQPDDRFTLQNLNLEEED